MTDIASALASSDLGEFEGADVLGVGIEIPSAAGGLQESLKIDPQVMHKDDEVLVLLRCKVTKVRFDPVRDTQGVRRVHVLVTNDATIVDGEVFEDALDANAERVRRAQEAAQGIQRLPVGEELLIQHGEGAHAQGLVDGCPECSAEQDAEDAEAGG